MAWWRKLIGDAPDGSKKLERGQGSLRRVSGYVGARAIEEWRSGSHELLGAVEFGRRTAMATGLFSGSIQVEWRGRMESGYALVREERE